MVHLNKEQEENILGDFEETVDKGLRSYYPQNERLVIYQFCNLTSLSFIASFSSLQTLILYTESKRDYFILMIYGKCVRVPMWGEKGQIVWFIQDFGFTCPALFRHITRLSNEIVQI